MTGGLFDDGSLNFDAIENKPVRSFSFDFDALISDASEEKFKEDFTAAEQKYKLPSGLLEKVAKAESNFNPLAVSPKKAKGLMQFTDETAAEYGVDQFNAQSSIEGAGKYLSSLTKKYDGDIRKALAAYNYGPTNVDKLIKQYGENWEQNLPEETVQYLRKTANAG